MSSREPDGKPDREPRSLRCECVVEASAPVLTARASSAHHVLAPTTGTLALQAGTRDIGGGFDLVYHYWPTSPGYKARYDEYLRFAFFRVIDGDAYAVSAIRLTASLKLVAPLRAPVRPWLRLGAGVFRIDRNLAPPDWNGTPYTWDERGPTLAVLVPGVCLGAGFDVRRSERTVTGLEIEYHRLNGEEDRIPAFTAFTVGLRVLLGW